MNSGKSNRELPTRLGPAIMKWLGIIRDSHLQRQRSEMGIRFYCPNGHKIHVKGFQAGKRGICPQCEARFRIPLESQIPVGASRNADTSRPISNLAISNLAISESDAPAADLFSSAAATLTASPTPESPAVVGDRIRDGTGIPTAETAFLNATPVGPPRASNVSWYVRPPSGGQFGPAQEQVFRSWIDEGRVSGDSLVWREGWQEWLAAGSIFPELATQVQPTTETAGSRSDSHPNAAQGELSQAGSAERNPGRRHNNYRRSRSFKPIALVVFLSLATAALLVLLVYVMQKS